jgi:type IV fimbrial biogenesis protein FimT
VAARGFTLLEMLVAMALLATLATLAAPGFGEYLRDCRRAATVNALSHAVHTGRTLAAARGLPFILCSTDDGSSCSGSHDWSGELLLRPDIPGGSGLESPSVQRLPLAADGARQTVRTNRGVVRFAPLTLSATTATLTVCDDRGPRAAAAVIISRNGRPRISARDASGGSLACP